MYNTDLLQFTAVKLYPKIHGFSRIKKSIGTSSHDLFSKYYLRVLKRSVTTVNCTLTPRLYAFRMTGG